MVRNGEFISVYANQVTAADSLVDGTDVCVCQTHTLSGSASLDWGARGQGFLLNTCHPIPGWGLDRDAWDYIRHHHLRLFPKDVPDPNSFFLFPS